MPKVTFTVNRLEMIDPQFVSLVERGANRLPFKVIKSDSEGGNMKNGMMGIDLARVFARKSDTPAIVGVVIRKGETVDAIKAAVEAAGFSISDAIDNDDGTLVFKQEGADSSLGSPVVVRLSDEVALVTKGFRPYDMDVSTGESSFAETCAAQGFYPGLYQFSETLTSSIRGVMYDAATQPEAAKAVAKLMDEARNYITTLIGQLPAKAFKLEGDALAVKAEAKAKKPAVPTPDKDASAQEEDVVPPVKDKKPADEAPAKAKKDDNGLDNGELVDAPLPGDLDGDSPVVDADAVGTAGPAVTETKSEDLVAALSVALSAALSPVIEAVQKQETMVIGALSSAIEAIGARVSKAEETVSQVTADVDQRLATVVPCHVTGDDPEQVVVQKTESKGEIDTAMFGRRRNAR